MSAEWHSSVFGLIRKVDAVAADRQKIRDNIENLQTRVGCWSEGVYSHDDNMRVIIKLQADRIDRLEAENAELKAQVDALITQIDRLEEEMKKK